LDELKKQIALRLKKRGFNKKSPWIKKAKERHKKRLNNPNWIKDIMNNYKSVFYFIKQRYK